MPTLQLYTEGLGLNFCQVWFSPVGIRPQGLVEKVHQFTVIYSMETQVVNISFNLYHCEESQAIENN